MEHTESKEPLASKIRPKNLKDFIGQGHLVAPDKPLRIAIEKKHLFSFILWGPPGVGKTTLARIYAEALSADFYDLSAVSAGKDDIRKIIETGRKTNPIKIAIAKKEFGHNWPRPKILFLDEIHRF